MAAGTQFQRGGQVLDGSSTITAVTRILVVGPAWVGDMVMAQSLFITLREQHPGASIDVSVELRAPEEAGTYQGNWGIKNTNGLAFGIGPAGVPFYVKIKVVNP
ncbi:MAG: NBR1-Ig-like domain-containing protein [Anaerolineales bacterium]